MPPRVSRPAPFRIRGGARAWRGGRSRSGGTGRATGDCARAATAAPSGSEHRQNQPHRHERVTESAGQPGVTKTGDALSANVLHQPVPREDGAGGVPEMAITGPGARIPEPDRADAA